jgi:hypothetical protein
LTVILFDVYMDYMRVGRQRVRIFDQSSSESAMGSQ